LDLYSKIDAGVDIEEPSEEVESDLETAESPY
jgi:hypothetical protein